MKRSRISLSGASVTAAALLTCCFGLISGCATTGLGESQLMSHAEATEITAAELRVRVRALAGEFSGLIEEAADHAMADSTRPEMRQRGLFWKTNAIPAMQSALFQPDPLAALFDAWVLVVQLSDFLADPEQGYAETERATASEAFTLMLSEIEALAELVRADDDIEGLRNHAVTWAAKHPIVETAASRPSASPELAHFTADTKIGLRQSLSFLTETRDDLAIRADVYTAYLPKQARWDAALAMHSI